MLDAAERAVKFGCRVHLHAIERVMVRRCRSALGGPTGDEGLELSDASEWIRHGFTREQADFLENKISRRPVQGFDRSTQMWLIGGLFATGLAVSGVIWAEIGSVRDELGAGIGSVRDELGDEIGSVRQEISSFREEVLQNRAAIAELAKGLTRIETILEERLPKDN